MLQRSPGRALVVLMADVIALVVLIVGLSRLTDPRFEILLFAAVGLAVTAVCLWASLTAPKRSQEVGTSPEGGTPPSTKEVDRVVGGVRAASDSGGLPTGAPNR